MRRVLPGVAGVLVLAALGVGLAAGPGERPAPDGTAPELTAPEGTGEGWARHGTDRPISRSDFGLRVPQEPGEPAYDGRFTFLRIRFGESGSGLRRGRFGRGRESPWAHDMPRAETNFARILAETTTVDPYMNGGRVVELDDPDLFRYPVAYIVEVGYWRPDEAEARGLREYLLKGGFLIVDDFRGGHIYNFIDQMRRVLPGAEVVELDPGHPIFDSFFHIEDPATALIAPTYPQYVPRYLGIFEDNDPSKRLMAVLNYNNDIGEYWEFSDRGYYPIDLSNEAYKFGVNYIVYGMTH